MAGEVKQLEFSDGETVATPTDTTPTSSFDPGTTNLIINGAMNFWQREIAATTITTSVSYITVDRFNMEAAGSAVVFDSSQDTDVPNTNFKYSNKLECISVTGTANIFHHQRIEADDIRPYIGKDVTFQFWVKSNVAKAFTFRALTPVSATEDSWSTDQSGASDTVFDSTADTLPTSWTLKSLSFTVPAGASDGLEVGFTGGGFVATDIIRTTGWMLYEGAAATGFKPAGRNQADEFAMCQRFYEKSYSQGVSPGTSSGVGLTYGGVSPGLTTLFMPYTTSFASVKRVTPAVVIYSRAGTLNFLTNETNNSDSLSVSGSSPSDRAIHPLTTSAGTGNDNHRFHYTADAEL